MIFVDKPKIEKTKSRKPKCKVTKKSSHIQKRVSAREVESLLNSPWSASLEPSSRRTRGSQKVQPRSRTSSRRTSCQSTDNTASTDCSRSSSVSLSIDLQFNKSS